MKVLETNMSGHDLIHYWNSIVEAKESGRFDFLIDNGDLTQEEFDTIDSIEDLCKAGFYFKILA